MVNQLNDPRMFLSAELGRRIQKNPRYSLRRFAQALGISHTVLSLVLAGKRPLSKKAAIKVSDFFGFDPEKRDSFVASRKTKLSQRMLQADRYAQLSLDTFAVIADWYHFAILSLLEVPGAKKEARWIAKRLGISEIEAKLALERIERLDLIGTPIDMKNTNSTAATRTFHRQLLEKALESMEQDPFELRDLSSMTMAIDPAQVPYARQRIRAFRDELTADLEKRGKPKEVYNLNVQFFPLSHSKEQS